MTSGATWLPHSQTIEYRPYGGIRVSDLACNCHTLESVSAVLC